MTKYLSDSQIVQVIGIFTEFDGFLSFSLDLDNQVRVFAPFDSSLDNGEEITTEDLKSLFDVVSSVSQEEIENPGVLFAELFCVYKRGVVHEIREERVERALGWLKNPNLNEISNSDADKWRQLFTEACYRL